MEEPTRRLLALSLAGLALVLGAPVSKAAAEGFELTAAQPAVLDGRLSFVAAGGSVLMVDHPTSALARVEDATGDLVLWTREWTVVDGNIVSVRDAEPERWVLRHATLAVETRSGAHSEWRAVTTGGSFAVAGTVHGPAVPTLLTSPHDEDHEAPADVAFRDVPKPPIRWGVGWTFLGPLDEPALPADATPTLRGPVLSLHGDVDLMIYGGRLETVDEDGTPVGRDLGDGGTAGLVRTERRTAALFHGAVGDAAIPLAGAWGAAAPRASWQVDGEMNLLQASGTVTREGRTYPVLRQDARLAFVGGVDAPAASLFEHSYRGDGRVVALAIDGTPWTLGPADAGLPTAAAGASLLALLAWTRLGQDAVARVAAAFYTRLTPSDVLTHPRRRIIMETVRAEPGVHLRELHRRAGGAWGPFSFHLRILARAGHLSVAREGAYSVVLPTGASSPPAIPHPLARAVFAATPEDGAPIALAEVSARVGASRELVSYHARGLEARGLVRRVKLDRAQTAFVRVREATPAP